LRDTLTGYPETRILLGSVLMEGVKYAYAEHYKQYPRDSNDFFLKPDGQRYSFRALIEEVYDEFGLKNGDTGFIQYRNEVVHQGRLSSLSRAQTKALASGLERTIEHRLLRILAYKGDYWDPTATEASGRPGVWVDFASVAV